MGRGAGPSKPGCCCSGPAPLFASLRFPYFGPSCHHQGQTQGDDGPLLTAWSTCRKYILVLLSSLHRLTLSGENKILIVTENMNTGEIIKFPECKSLTLYQHTSCRMSQAPSPCQSSCGHGHPITHLTLPTPTTRLTNLISAFLGPTSPSQEKSLNRLTVKLQLK